eukprot:692907-Alexandrium_andersonii.AAC.1
MGVGLGCACTWGRVVALGQSLTMIAGFAHTAVLVQRTCALVATWAAYVRNSMCRPVMSGPSPRVVMLRL